MKLKPSAASPTSLEALEARTLFSSYSYESLIDHLNLTAPLRDVSGPNDGSSGFGAVVAGLGDINDDGFADFAVSAPGTDSGSPLGIPGNVYIYSGQDGQIIRTLTDGAGGFGLSLANVGDVNADGVPDLLVGSPWLDPVADLVNVPTGGAYVYSGADGTVLRTFTGDTANGEFGRVVVRAADINEDGVAELVIGAPASGLDGAGQVFVFSGIDGALLHTLSGESAGDRFGDAIAAAPPGVLESDDAAAFLAVGAPMWGAANEGRVSVFGHDASILYTLEGNNNEGRLGTALAIAVRALGGSNDYLLYIGEPGADLGADTDVGAIRSIHLGGGFLGIWFLGDTPSGHLGRLIANVGDVTGDDSDDLLIVEDSVDGPRTRYAFTTEFGGWGIWDTPPIGPHSELAPVLTGAIAAVGDVNNDGVPDIITGDGLSRVTVISAISIGETITFEGASPNQQHFWSQNSQWPFVVLDGELLSYSRIPGLTPQARIQAILNDGTIVFSAGFNGPLLVLADGVATPLSDLVTTHDGQAPNYENLTVVRAGMGGHLLLTDGGSVWTYRDGVTTFVWRGVGTDINTAGAVVGSYQQSDEVWGAGLWIPGSAPVFLTGLATAGAINDDNVVTGVLADSFRFNNPGHIAIWDDGVVTDLAAGPDVTTSTIPATWRFHGIDADGRILADIVTNAYRGPTVYSTYLYEPGAGLRSLQAATVGAPTDWYTSVSSFSDTRLPTVAFSPDGTIVAHTAVLTSGDDSVRFTIRDGSPTATLSTDDAQYILGINQFNELIVISNTGSGWRGRTLRTGIPASMNVGIAAFFEASSSRALAVLSTGDEVWLIQLNEVAFGENPEILLSSVFNRLPIERGLTVFTNVEGVAHIAGIDENGDVVIFYRNLDFSAMVTLGWKHDNLSDHLDEQDLETPDFVGGLTAFATSWSGMNINGLDAEGHVRTIWWAQGMTLWYTNDLTAETGTTPLHGQLTSYSTPWGTLHMTGLNEDGDVTTVWWAPGFGADWRSDVLVPNSIALDPESLTSYVTPWGGLNIAGRDLDSGRLAVYWWSPESNAWAVDTLDLRDGAESPEMQGESAGSVSADGHISLSVVGTNVNLYRYSWEPGDDDLWTLENLTELAVG